MRGLSVFLIVFMLIGCTVPINDEALPTISAEEPEYLPLYFYEEEKEESPFEPDSGCLTGAFIVRDGFIDGDLDKFEAITQKSHDIYSYEMKALDPFPTDWILTCFSKNKIPIITLYPQNKNEPFDKTAIETAAKTLNTFEIPMLLQFYPNPEGYGDSGEYIEFFREAHDIFLKNAPKVSFIWSVAKGMANQGATYYPGGDYVDWIGLNYYQKSEEMADEDLSAISSWYYEWQGEKPLVVFAAVSHYSTGTTVYTEQESAKRLSELYAFIKEYPRIKAVVYRNENEGLGAPVKAARENYLLSDNQVMLAAYREAVGDGYFTGRDEEKEEVEEAGGEWLRSAFDAVSLNGRVYIPVYLLKYQLQVAMLADTRIISGREYVSENGFSLLKVERNDEKIFIKLLS